MLNQMVIVGRLVDEPKMKELEDGRKVANLTLAVPRSYKNANGEYDTDFIDCILWGGVAETTHEYCKKGDLLGVRGRIQTNTYEKDGKNIKNTEVVAEKVTFLSSSNKDKENDEVEAEI